MFAKLKKIFLMSEEDFNVSLNYYIKKFGLQESWSFKVVDELPATKTNYPNKEDVLAFTDLGSLSVVFKRTMFRKPAFLVRGYIRHELRHCQQMEKIHSAIMAKGLESLAGLYTMMVINNDNLKGYQNSMMEADAWLAFIGIYINIDKMVKKLIKRNIGFLL